MDYELDFFLIVNILYIDDDLIDKSNIQIINQKLNTIGLSI